MTPPIARRRGRRRILFVAEAVTLAHVARPAALAAALDAERYEIFFACDAGARKFVGFDDHHFMPIDGIGAARFTDRLRRGVPVYLEEELQQYVATDQALFDLVEPDLVVGDFRLSLSVSARLPKNRLPYACITNAYWSPHTPDRSLPLPVLPWTRYVPISIAQAVFDALQHTFLAPHCRPLNAVRVAHGLEPLPSDLRDVYTDADDTLYADSPALFPLPGAPARHLHLGPVLWSPPVPLPPWWNEVPEGRPVVYVTMGSSGRADLLETILDGLASLDVSVVASTAGAAIPRNRWQRAWFSDYLPGQTAAARAALVVCNGGSPTSQQALEAGTPVLGICSNMDQMLNMRAVVKAGFGTALRTDRLSAAEITAAAERLLQRERVAVGSAGDAPQRFAQFIQARLG